MLVQTSGVMTPKQSVTETPLKKVLNKQKDIQDDDAQITLGLKEAEEIGAKCNEIQGVLYQQKQLLRDNREYLNEQGCNLDSSQISIDLESTNDDVDDTIGGNIDQAVNQEAISEAVQAKEEEWNKERDLHNKKQSDLNSQLNQLKHEFHKLVLER